MHTPSQILLFLLLFAFETRVCAEAAPAVASAGDYQKVADKTEWIWHEYLATPLEGMTLADSTYDVMMTSDHRDHGVLKFAILRDGKKVYAWKGHEHTVFRIEEDRLYYALFHPSSSGGTIVAVNLNTGKELWTSPLTALGFVQHSAYRSSMTLDADSKTVSVYGNESMGRYFEIKDAATGKTIGHKLFPKP